jgi:hypothetical protein
MEEVTFDDYQVEFCYINKTCHMFIKGQYPNYKLFYGNVDEKKFYQLETGSSTESSNSFSYEFKDLKNHKTLVIKMNKLKTGNDAFLWCGETLLDVYHTTDIVVENMQFYQVNTDKKRIEYLLYSPESKLYFFILSPRFNYSYEFQCFYSDSKDSFDISKERKIINIDRYRDGGTTIIYFDNMDKIYIPTPLGGLLPYYETSNGNKTNIESIIMGDEFASNIKCNFLDTNYQYFGPCCS